MNALQFEPRPMDRLATEPANSSVEWIWEGYLARGNITLLTSHWKSGKTTLVTGLLRALGPPPGCLPVTAFLGQMCQPAKAVIVSEESPVHWAARQRTRPIGAHARLVSRPFPGRPTPAQWDELVVHAECMRADGELDVLVVDPLATFLPGRSDSDPGTLLDLLHPLRRLAELGVAVLILHHPRKRPAEEGSLARGSGALLGFVDIILELSRYGPLAADRNRRKLVTLSRHTGAPAPVVYEWSQLVPDFIVVTDVRATRFREHWDVVEAILLSRRAPCTHKELLADWPAGEVPPTGQQLYEWLSRAVAENLAQRIGSGTRNDPYQFQLSRETRARLDPKWAARQEWFHRGHPA